MAAVRSKVVRAALAAAMISLSCVLGDASPASALAITSPGPLTKIDISPELNCAVNHAADTSGEFFGDTACATLIATGGVLYGPTSIPAGSAASPRTSYTLVSQVSAGTGTASDPFRIVTVVTAGTSGVRLTQTDSYVVGQESYRTDVQVANTSGATVSAVLFKAGDCFLQNSDEGFGAYDQATGAIACVAGVDSPGGAAVPGTRIQQFFPLTPGSNYLEDDFNDVWAAVGTRQPLPNQCAECANYVDNGIALSWSLAIAAGGSSTVSHFTTFSPLGIAPLSTTKTADAATAAAGAADGYTITVHNPNTSPVVLDSIFDTLPAGFTYTTGSTTGATTADPTVIGQTLTWAGPFTVPATSSSSLHFAVTVASTPGQYSNQAGATSSALAVAPTGPTAAVTVTGVPGATPTLTVATSGTGTGTVTSTPAGISCGTACSTTAPTGTTFTLTASPAAGSVFTGWTGGGCTGTGTCVVTLGTDTTVTATFTAVPDISIISPQGTVMTLVATTGVVMLCRRRQRRLAQT